MKFSKGMQKGKIVGVYKSIHPDKSYQEDDYFVTEPVDSLQLTTEGIKGDRHFGYTVESGGRFTTLYSRGTQVRNNRQWSAISPEEIDSITDKLGLEQKVSAELLGINFLIEGIENLTQLPYGTYLVFSPDDGEFEPRRTSDVVLVSYAEALPCLIAGKALVAPYNNPSLENRFPKAAINQRGLTGWVEKGGIVMPGYTVWALTPTGKD